MAGVEVILIFSDLPMFLQAVPTIDYYSPVMFSTVFKLSIQFIHQVDIAHLVTVEVVLHLTIMFRTTSQRFPFI